MGRLAGKTAIITGAGRGIGFSTAALFANEGANVVICDIQEESCECACKEITEEGGSALSQPMDVINEGDWKSVFAKSIEAFGQVDVVMNCAGIGDQSPIEDTSVDVFDKLCDVNLKGVFLGCKHAILHMKTRPADMPSASIINVSSTAGFVGTARSGIYTMTKGGVRLFSKSVAVEVSAFGYNIRCNSLHPGGTETPMFDNSLEQRNVSKEAFSEIVKRRNLLGRRAKPIEIAYGALFLASDESSFMTGTELALDGGYAAR
ncbi:SDR family NAD(P)-dependent oxidoreductase [Sneathiella sp. HT1-7]|uniref:SDR family NAD(P)-dependent oxidoreductase n=1 Tax=Sneathiella sp. HT1-7 TaxID=2887192 RepID=UPI001D1392F6|nr:SDR family oxidoreductase [Sneathiella sp. HT1-7]MCC3305242.1 SDR family oxidoreductase [Sneathiella sp. HT1-7]